MGLLCATTTLLQNVYRPEVKSTTIYEYLVVNEHAVTDTAGRQSYGSKQIWWSSVEETDRLLCCRPPGPYSSSSFLGTRGPGGSRQSGLPRSA